MFLSCFVSAYTSQVKYEKTHFHSACDIMFSSLILLEFHNWHHIFILSPSPSTLTPNLLVPIPRGNAGCDHHLPTPALNSYITWWQVGRDFLSYWWLQDGKRRGLLIRWKGCYSPTRLVEETSLTTERASTEETATDLGFFLVWFNM